MAVSTAGSICGKVPSSPPLHEQSPRSQGAKPRPKSVGNPQTAHSFKGNHQSPVLLQSTKSCEQWTSTCASFFGKPIRCDFNQKCGLIAKKKRTSNGKRKEQLSDKNIQLIVTNQFGAMLQIKIMMVFCRGIPSKKISLSRK